MEPLHVTAVMGGAAALSRPTLLDGPLLAAVVEERAEQAGVDPYDLPWLDPREALPLDVERGGHHWYSRCSDARYEVAARDAAHWSKRFDLDEAEEVLERDRSVNLKSGRYRIHRQPLYLVVTARIEWWCLGDRVRLEELLPRVRYLGKKRAYGHGPVLRWEVEPSGDDWSLRGPEGELMRPLPLAHKRVGRAVDRGELVVTREETLQPNPPYWTQHHPALCAVDGRWT
ncbi:MAG TPA: hypothetical protein DCZ11_01810 [Gammaproteobacteria bacterium]|nr:hypothetical protein [Gammaproteobacteria bacterium]MCH77159.1 hypothetical protein [Gammaproteobacteria bacterium]